jgi:DNA mismatch repair protein MutS2
MNHRQTVYVVHGYGTGRLRQAVRDYLKGHPSVAGFERAPQKSGGDGVTVVTLSS